MMLKKYNIFKQNKIFLYFFFFTNEYKRFIKLIKNKRKLLFNFYFVRLYNLLKKKKKIKEMVVFNSTSYYTYPNHNNELI